MLTMKDAVTILGIILGCCLFAALGAYYGKKTAVDKVVKISGVVALIGVVLYVIYTVWGSLSGTFKG